MAGSQSLRYARWGLRTGLIMILLEVGRLKYGVRRGHGRPTVAKDQYLV